MQHSDERMTREEHEPRAARLDESWAPDENPLVLRFLRTRVLRGAFPAALIGILLIGAAILILGGIIGKSNRKDPAEVHQVLFYFLFGLAGTILVFMGSYRVSLALMLDRASGSLEGLRLSALHPGVSLAGYLIGAPVREYLLAFALTPHFVYCMVRGGIAFVDAFQAGVALLAVSALFHVLAAVGTLSVPTAAGVQPRQAQAGSGVLALFLVGVMLVPSLIRLADSGAQNPFDVRIPFFGLPVPLILYLLGVIGFMGMFAAAAAARKLAREGAPAFTKRQAIWFYVLLHLILLGASWARIDRIAHDVSMRSVDWAVERLQGLFVGLVIVDILVSIWLIAMMVPTAPALIREWHRSRRPGRRLRADSEGATHVPWGLGLVGISVAFYLVPIGQLWLGGTALSGLPVAILLPPLLLGTFILYAGASREFFVLRLRRRGRNAAGAFHIAFLALVWMAPVLLGVGVGVGLGQPAAGAILASPSLLANLTAAFLALNPYPDKLVGPQPLLVAGLGVATQIVLAAVFLGLLRGAHARLRAAETTRPAPEAAATPAEGPP
jgi:hypothetical protein